jgi:NTP pyrophosphatase (non-canonical NTP hydrolase)
MKFKKYLKKSEAFVSGTFDHETKDPLYQRELQLKGVIEQFIKATEDLDAIKKHKFYGKDLPKGFQAPLPLGGLSEAFASDLADPSEQDLHAVVGICTEAGELLEAMYKHKWKQEEFDVVNAKEEIGDVFWYMAILFRNYKWNIKAIWDTNIKKLVKRYGKKFSSNKANNRDLDAERKILEK